MGFVDRLQLNGTEWKEDDFWGGSNVDINSDGSVVIGGELSAGGGGVGLDIILTDVLPDAYDPKIDGTSLSPEDYGP